MCFYIIRNVYYIIVCIVNTTVDNISFCIVMQTEIVDLKCEYKKISWV